MYIFSGIFMNKITIFVYHTDIRIYDVVIINTQHINGRTFDVYMCVRVSLLNLCLVVIFMLCIQTVTETL